MKLYHAGNKIVIGTLIRVRDQFEATEYNLEAEARDWFPKPPTHKVITVGKTTATEWSSTTEIDAERLSKQEYQEQQKRLDEKVKELGR